MVRGNRILSAGNLGCYRLEGVPRLPNELTCDPCHCSTLLVTTIMEARVLHFHGSKTQYCWLIASCRLQVLDACLKEITTALLQADVNVKLVMNLRTNVKTRANNADKGAGLNKRKIIEKSVVDELSSMLSSGSDEKQLVDLKKGKPNVVMFVGLQVSSLFLPGSCRVAS